MPRTQMTHSLALLGVLSLAFVGCQLERKERITVAPDGQVSIQLLYEADSRSELYDGDAAPSVEAGWNNVVETVEVDEEGKEHYKLTAGASFPPGAELPRNFSKPGDPDSDLYVQFPTQLTREQRPNGTYYHFYRIYPRRGWAQVRVLEKVIEDEIKDIVEKEFEELTREEIVTALRAGARFEYLKMLTFARAAFRHVTPDAPQDCWLKVHGGIMQLHREVAYEHFASLMTDKDKAAEIIDAQVERLEADLMDRLRSTLVTACGYSQEQLNEFVRRFKRNQRHFDITEDVEHETFEITVTMPGEIVGSNARSLGGNTATWRFRGELFLDRDLELMVSSRVGALDSM